MENFSNFHSADSTPPPVEKAPIENPYFFESNRGRSVESTVEKRALQKVAKVRLEGEGDEAYKERMGKALNSILSRNFINAAEKRVSFLEGSKKGRVNARDLLPIVELQNKVMSTLAGLKKEDRVDYLIQTRKVLYKWIEDEQVSGDIVSGMRTMFDGCESVCNYMDMRKEKHGEAVEFYTDVFLDWKYGIDLVEFEKKRDGEVEVRLVQNKSSFGSSEKVEDSLDKHTFWVQNELMGMNNVLDRFADVLEAEVASSHQENLREVGGHFFDSSIKALDLVRMGKEGSLKAEIDHFFAGESELSKLAFALSFYETEDKDREEVKSRFAREIAHASREDIITGLNVSKIYSVFAVNEEEQIAPYLLYSERRDGRELFVGTEKNI